MSQQTNEEIKQIIYEWLAIRAPRDIANSHNNGLALARIIRDKFNDVHSLDNFDAALKIADAAKQIEHIKPEVRVVEKIVQVASKTPRQLIQQESAPPSASKREQPSDPMADITKARSAAETIKINNDFFFACQEICTNYLGNSHGTRAVNKEALQEKFIALRKANLVPAEIFKQLTAYRKTLRD